MESLDPRPKLEENGKRSSTSSSFLKLFFICVILAGLGVGIYFFVQKKAWKSFTHETNPFQNDVIIPPQYADTKVLPVTVVDPSRGQVGVDNVTDPKNLLYDYTVPEPTPAPIEEGETTAPTAPIGEGETTAPTAPIGEGETNTSSDSGQNDESSLLIDISPNLSIIKSKRARMSGVGMNHDDDDDDDDDDGNRRYNKDSEFNHSPRLLMFSEAAVAEGAVDPAQEEFPQGLLVTEEELKMLEEEKKALEKQKKELVTIKKRKGKKIKGKEVTTSSPLEKAQEDSILEKKSPVDVAVLNVLVPFTPAQTQRIDRFAVMTLEDDRGNQYFTGAKPSPTVKRVKGRGGVPRKLPYPRGITENSVQWKDYDARTFLERRGQPRPPVKDQGRCGCCWAVATSTVAEYRLGYLSNADGTPLKNAKGAPRFPVEISPMYIIANFEPPLDARERTGCDGNSYQDAFRIMAKNGIVVESLLPMTEAIKNYFTDNSGADLRVQCDGEDPFTQKPVKKYLDPMKPIKNEKGEEVGFQEVPGASPKERYFVNDNVEVSKPPTYGGYNVMAFPGYYIKNKACDPKMSQTCCKIPTRAQVAQRVPQKFVFKPSTFIQNAFFFFTGSAQMYDNKTIQTEILTRGPVGASINVTQEFLNYTGDGILTKAQTQNSFSRLKIDTQTGMVMEGRHMVVVVGWGTTKENMFYWILQNSWGSDWGDRGFCKLEDGALGIFAPFNPVETFAFSTNLFYDKTKGSNVSNILY